MASSDGETEFESLLRQLREKTATREGLSLRVYEGPEKTPVLVQELQLENSDLIDEHWTDVWNPEEASRQQVQVCRAREGMAVVLLVVAGDKGAGKTTFFAGLTSRSLPILQAFRYNQASFFNLWYGPTLTELRELLHPTRRAQPFFQTALAHGFLHIPTPELEFFLEDEEFLAVDGAAEAGAAPLQGCSAEAQSVLVKLLEIGGDFIQELMELTSSGCTGPASVEPQGSSPGHPVACGGSAGGLEDPTRTTILRSVLQYLRQCSSLGYFINLDTMFPVDPSQRTSKLFGPALGATVTQLDFLGRVLPPGAKVLCYCSRHPNLAATQRDQHWPMTVLAEMQAVLGALLPTLNSAAQPLSLSVPDCREELLMDPQLGLCGLLEIALLEVQRSLQWRIRLHGFHPTAHLDESSGEYDYTALLTTLHRLLRHSASISTDSVPVVAHQLINLAYDRWEGLLRSGAPATACRQWFTKEDLFELLDTEGKAPNEGAGLDDLLHPMPRVPPMVLLDSFDSAVALLCQPVRRGTLALPLFNGLFADTALRLCPRGASKEVGGLWRARPSPSESHLSRRGFRLPLYPASRAVLRGVVDLAADAQ
eukprot:RCo005410